MVRMAEELAAKNGWFLARQFENEANPAYHRQTTGPEILRDFADLPLDYFVTGYGTGGTLTGAGQVLKTARPGIQVIVAEPEQAALLHDKPWQPHKIQGWTPDFIPQVLDREVIDRVITVSDARAVECSTCCRPRSRESSFASTPTTWWPVRAKTSAMPAPMVPSPTTPTEVKSRVPLLMGGILARRARGAP
jgi:cysteine synthase